MKKRVLAGLLAILVTLTLTSCSSSPGSSSASSGSSSDAGQTADPADGDTVIMMDNGIPTPWWPEFVDAVKDATGVTLEGMARPENWSDFNTKITAMLAAGSDGIDILSIDDLMLASFRAAGYLDTIDDVMTPDVREKFYTGQIDAMVMQEGHAYAIPITTDIMVLYVNKKMFEEAGLSYPTNQEEFINCAQALTKGDTYGYGVPWMAGGYLFNEYTRWIMDFGGDANDWTSDAAKNGIQFMYDLVHKYNVTPEAAISEEYSVMNQKFIDGKYAMVWQWPYLYNTEGAAGKFGDEFDIIPSPTFGANGTGTNATVNVSYYHTLNKYSTNKDAAKKVMAFVASKEGQNLLLQSETGTCGYKEIMEDPASWQINGFLEHFKKYSEAGSIAGVKYTPSTSLIMDTHEAIVQKFITGSITLDECMTQAQAAIDAASNK